MSRLIFTFLLLSFSINISTQDLEDQIETEFNGFSNETIVRLKKTSLNCDSISGMLKKKCYGLEVSVHYQGQQRKVASKVKIRLTAENKDWHNEAERSLQIVADKVRYDLGTMKLLSTQSKELTQVDILEQTISYPLFLKIASALTVKIKLGDKTMNLKPRIIAALKEIALRNDLALRD
jgi:hypothetical protein